jgi:hypothetical protein
MKNFAATQYGVQSLRFYYNDNDDFIPLLVNSGGTSSCDVASPKLPLFICENLNSLRARVMFPNINPANKDIIEKYPKLYIPVLGIYTKSTFDVSQYVYSTGQAAANIFTQAQQSVSFDPVSCRLDTKYIDFDTSPAINTVMSAWNSAMDTLSTYMQQPREVSGDPGINVLSVVGDCWFVQEIASDQSNNKTINVKEIIPVSSKKKKDKPSDRKKKKHVTSSDDEDYVEQEVPLVTVYTKVIRNYLSQQVPITDIAPIKKAMWIPEWKLYQNNNNPAGSITVDTIRSTNLLPWNDVSGVNFSASSNGDYTNMEEIRKMFVTHCVKNRSAEDNSTVKTIQALSQAGKAGLLGDLVGTFGGEVANTLFKTAASFIPF